MNLEQLARELYADGKNVAAGLREHLGVTENTPEIIRLAYDMQAGSYVEAATRDDFVMRYAQQLAEHLAPHIDGTLLDVGTGEMTTLSHLVAALPVKPSKVFASDISGKRLEVGQAYAAVHMPDVPLEVFTADIAKLPLPDQSIDVITSNHALEPNGGREEELVRELLRVGKKLVLFEPDYENASDEGKARMTSHGYITRLRDYAESVTPLELLHNPLNPTSCFVIERL